MHYHIAREGQQLGQFTEEELSAGLFEGRYRTTDLAWREGMVEWKPLGEIMGQGVTSLRHATAGTGSEAAAQTSPIPGTAVASLVLGILSVVTCWLGIIFAIPGIICGHVALARIRQTGGGGGRGMAVAGLVMSYIAPVLTVIAILASLSMPIFGKMREKGQAQEGLALARKLALGVRLHAADHAGAYPKTLDELAQTGAIPREVLEQAGAFKPEGWAGEPGFEYRGATLSERDPGESVLLISKCHDRTGKYIVVTNDTAASLQKPESP